MTKKKSIFGQLASIGYEGKTIDEFCAAVKKDHVDLVCDVRKNAISRKRGFSKNKLKAALAEHGVEYIHLPSLGIPSETRKKARTERDWERMLAGYEAGLAPDDWAPILQALAEHRKVALLCFEKDPESCHRTRLAHRITCAHPELHVEELGAASP